MNGEASFSKSHFKFQVPIWTVIQKVRYQRQVPFPATAALDLLAAFLGSCTLYGGHFRKPSSVGSGLPDQEVCDDFRPPERN